MSKIVQRITEMSKTVVAISGAITTIIGLLGWIGFQTYKISSDFKKAVAIVPVVEQHSKDIEQLKQDVRITYNTVAILDDHTKFIITELDDMIDICAKHVAENQDLDMNIVNKLLYYRDNLNIISNKQKRLINSIERAADRRR